MSYTPTEWQNGDVISSEKLNKMELGIADGASGGGVLVIGEVTEDTTTRLNKTWQEIWDACESGLFAFVGILDGSMYLQAPITSIGYMDETYGINTIDVSYACLSPDDYPVKDGSA